MLCCGDARSDDRRSPPGSGGRGGGNEKPASVGEDAESSARRSLGGERDSGDCRRISGESIRSRGGRANESIELSELSRVSVAEAVAGEPMRPASGSAIGMGGSGAAAWP